MNTHDLLVVELLSRPRVKQEVERLIAAEREECAMICDKYGEPFMAEAIREKEEFK